jgi:ABC-type antimicrobial peptide transport system permease subunit
MDILVKARQLSPALLGAVAGVARNVNPEAAVGSVRPLADLITDSLARQRFLLILIIAFAALAIGLCAVGVYGVFSYSVNLRMREFGIRSAIGAQRRDLLLLVLGECLVVIVPGILLGFAISAGFGQLMQSLVYGVSPDDPWSRGVAIMSIASLCLLCVLIPGLRAARVDTGAILREQ